ncbi:MAG: D-alanyl-lipoteichoic acid biosynthesis protein DltD [Clostridiales Family XIII bacterium]|nr:D-alanyl-lipoteichoic acid biosynthesis protein DltD [Clostridiales Family XIII bacterium]
MSAKRKLLSAVLPLMIAFALVAGAFLLAFGGVGISEQRLNTAASSLSELIIKGESVKNHGAEHPNYVLFCGSSELRRFDPFHPSVLAEKYQRWYRPFLLGTAGTQSMIHFLALQSVGDGLSGQRAVFIISPQWFQDEGLDEGSFDEFFSPIQVFEWICEDDADPVSRVYFAKRMLAFELVRQDGLLNGVFEKIAAGKTADRSEMIRCRDRLYALSAEDRLFGNFFAESHRGAIRAHMKRLPDVYDADRLDNLAFQIGERESGNNEFQIQNRYYTDRIKLRLKFFKGRQKEVSYDKSPEYGDFQLVLNEIAKNKMDVLFIIPPVNQRWAEYIGLSKDMYLRFEAKIREQLLAQGFDRILDLSRQGGEPYFMQDPTHLGWRGWVAIDRAVKPFLEEEPARGPEYKIDPYYFSDEWCGKVVSE